MRRKIDEGYQKENRQQLMNLDSSTRDQNSGSIQKQQRNISKQPVQKDDQNQEIMFGSYLQIRQVESKQIPITKFKRVQSRNNDSNKMNNSENVLSFSNLNPDSNQSSFLNHILDTINSIVIFNNKYPSLKDHYGEKYIVSLTIQDLVNSFEQYNQQQESQTSKSPLIHSSTEYHIPISHCQQKVNPVSGAFSINLQQSVDNESVSLFSRMMKLRQSQTNRNHQSNISQQSNIHCNSHFNSLKSLKKIYFSLQKIISTILPSSSQQSEKFKSFFIFLLKTKLIKNVQKNNDKNRNFHQNQRRFSNFEEVNQSQTQDHEWSSKYLTSRNKQSTIIHKNNHLQIDKYILKSICLSNQQYQLIMESVIIYTLMIKQILIGCNIDEVQRSNHLISFKSKQTNFSSFPSVNSKSIFSFPSIQVKQRDFYSNLSNRENKIFNSQNYEQQKFFGYQLLAKRIEQNKNVFDRKNLTFMTQNYQKFQTSKSKVALYSNLLYDIWLSQMLKNNKKEWNAEGFTSQKYQQIFGTIYELLPSDKQTITFLLFVLKQIQYNISMNFKKKDSHNILKVNSHKTNKNQVQNQFKSSFVSIKQSDQMKKVANNQKPQNNEAKTKRIKRQKLRTNQNQLQQTRNLNFDQKYINQKENKQKNLSNSLKNNSQKVQNLQNSSSKLTLSRLYQSKLNNIMKKTQKINQDAKKVPSNLNKNPSQSQLFLSKQHSEINLKSKMLLMRSKNPTDHQQQINILQLKQTLVQKNIQLQQKQNLIKKMMFMQQINQIDSKTDTKNLEVIYSNKIKNITNQYKQEIKSKQEEIKLTKINLQQKNRYISQVSKQRKIQAKILQESNQMHFLKKWTLSNQDKYKLKAKSYQSLANLKKGCFKEVYLLKNNQNIQDLSNITTRDQSLSLIKNQVQKQLSLKLNNKKPVNTKDHILTRLQNLQQKINKKNKFIQPKFFLQT